MAHLSSNPKVTAASRMSKECAFVSVVVIAYICTFIIKSFDVGPVRHCIENNLRSGDHYGRFDNKGSLNGHMRRLGTRSASSGFLRISSLDSERHSSNPRGTETLSKVIKGNDFNTSNMAPQHGRI